MAAVTLTTNWEAALSVCRAVPAQCVKSAPRLLCGARAEVGSSGRESRCSAACSSRARSDSGVSAYIVECVARRASALGHPGYDQRGRTVLIVASIVSPVRMTFEGLTRSPFTCTRPPRTAPFAALRVLNMRAAQSHLSIRT